MARWWRAYDEAVDDPKLILLSDKLHRAWFGLLCVASANGGSLPGLDVIAVKLRMTKDRVRHLIAELSARELLDGRDGKFSPHNWNGRQFRSDTDPTAAERAQRYRDAKRDASRSVTRDDTHPSRGPEYREQITDSERKKEPSLRSGAKSKTRMPEDWQPTEADRDFALKLGMRLEETEAEIPRCRDHFRAKGEARADWSATWRNWCRKHLEISNGGVNGRGQKPNADAGRGGLAGTLAKLKEHVERARDGAEDRSSPPPPRLLSYGGG